MTPPKLIKQIEVFRRWFRRGLNFQPFLLVKWYHRGLNKNTQNRTMKMQTVKSLGTHKGFCPNDPAKNSQGRHVQKTLLQTLVRMI